MPVSDCLVLIPSDLANTRLQFLLCKLIVIQFYYFCVNVLCVIFLLFIYLCMCTYVFISYVRTSSIGWTQGNYKIFRILYFINLIICWCFLLLVFVCCDWSCCCCCCCFVAIIRWQLEVFAHFSSLLNQSQYYPYHHPAAYFGNPLCSVKYLQIKYMKI